MSNLMEQYHRMIPKIWVSDEIPARVLFVKGRSGIDPDCLVAFADGEPDRPLWIVFNGDYFFKHPDYFVCADGREFRARPVKEAGTVMPAQRNGGAA